MSKAEKKKWHVDRANLPKLYPTHRHQAQFWEQLGRTIATFGFLEEVLAKAILAFTGTREYSPEEIEEAYQAWQTKLEKALTDQLWNLSESYGKAVREHPDATSVNIDELVQAIKETTKIRNVLCHASWGVPDEEEKSLPFFVNRQAEKFNTKIDVIFLKQVQSHVVDLACFVIDSVTHMGFQFPGSRGPGQPIW